MGNGSTTNGRKGLNSRQEKFVENYLTGMTAVEAYMKAGYNYSTMNSAYVASSRLLSNVKIVKEIEKRSDAIREGFNRKLSSIANKALNKLPELVDHGTKEDGIKLGAINAALKYAGLEPTQNIGGNLVVKIVGANLSEYPEAETEED